MKAINLNNAEMQVYEACKTAARCDGDNGYEFTIDSIYGIFIKTSHSDVRMARKVLKGYLGQLTKKGLIEKWDDCYFDFGVLELTPDWCKNSTFDYDFEITITE